MTTQRLQLQANIPESTTGTKQSKNEPVLRRKKNYVATHWQKDGRDFFVALFLGFWLYAQLHRDFDGNAL